MQKVISIAVFSLLFSCLFINVSFAETDAIDSGAVIQETQHMTNTKDELKFVWWIPVDFWQISLREEKDMTTAQIDEITKIFSPYLTVVVVDGKVGPMGGVKYISEADIRAGIKIRDRQGKLYGPLDEDKLDPDFKNGLGFMKPVFANLLGPMGENMQIFVFPVADSKGQKIADATKEGSFTVLLDGKEFKWRLPLGSLLPSKTCPACGEKLSGAYKFCHWDGTKL